MATPGTAPRPAAPRDDWAASATDTIDRVVTGLGDKTTKIPTAIASGIVYGLVIGAAASVLLVLVSIAAVRALNVYLPIHPYPRAVWISDATVGGILTLAGLFVWRKRRTKGA
jgi:hypothetical protein